MCLLGNGSKDFQLNKAIVCFIYNFVIPVISEKICRLFYMKIMPNSIDFYKEIFLHVVLVRIIVP